MTGIRNGQIRFFWDAPAYLWAERLPSARPANCSPRRAELRADLTSCFIDSRALPLSPQGCKRAADNKVPSPSGLQFVDKPHENMGWLGVIRCCMGVAVTHRDLNSLAAKHFESWKPRAASVEFFHSSPASDDLLAI